MKLQQQECYYDLPNIPLDYYHHYIFYRHRPHLETTTFIYYFHLLFLSSIFINTNINDVDNDDVDYDVDDDDVDYDNDVDDDVDNNDVDNDERYR